MKAPFVALGFLSILTAVAAAQPASSSQPMLSLAKRSADGKALEAQQYKTVCHPETSTVLVPVTISEEVDGEIRTKTVQKAKERTRMVCNTVSELRAFSFRDLEVRNVSGGKFKADDMADLFTEELTPVILVERQTVVVDGKETVRPVKFDEAYLKVFKPETLIVFLPPTPAVTRVPPGLSPIAPASPATLPMPTPILPEPVAPQPAE